MRGYRFKLYTKAKERRQLSDMMYLCGKYYNRCIKVCRLYYRRTGRNIFVDHKQYALDYYLTETRNRAKARGNGNIRKYDAIPRATLCNIHKRIRLSYNQFFRNLKQKRRASPPKFQRVREYGTLFFQPGNGAAVLPDDQIRVGKTRYRYFRNQQWTGQVKTMTVTRDACGDFWVSLTVDETRTEQMPNYGRSVGFDFGIKTFLTGSDGSSFEAPQYFRESLKELAKLQKQFARKERRSNKREAMRLKIARLHRKIRHQREHFQWELSNRLLEKYDIICFETLNLQGMSRSFGRKIGEYALYSFIQKLTYLAEAAGKTIIQIDRMFPSSKLCSCCGFKNTELTLSDREWTCPQCGRKHDRDINAAINIHNEGMALYHSQEKACPKTE